MIAGQEWLLIGAVAGVGILHTLVPDHWVPITLIARQRGWSKREVTRAALIAGTGHTVSTLLIGLLVWIAGVAFATKFGNLVSLVSSIALIAFGAWIALSSLRDLRSGHVHEHGREQEHAHGREHETAHAGTSRSDTTDPSDPIYRVAVGVPSSRLDYEHGEHAGERYDGSAAGSRLTTKHAHAHTHAGRSTVHIHVHAHGPDTWHQASTAAIGTPLHEHAHERSLRTTLLLILGSSPMVEGIPAFFAASKFGAGLIAVMAVVFALSTIATYVTLCLTSVATLRRISLGPFERYGEVSSGTFIALVGLVFLFFPIL